MTETMLDTSPLSVNDAPSGFTHLPGCPAGEDKVETYTATRAAEPDKAIPARTCRITRCVQCGAHGVQEV